MRPHPGIHRGAARTPLPVMLPAPNLVETWLLDGTTWVKGPSAPAGLEGRVGAEMAYDPDIGKVVLFGGSGAGIYRDTWLYDGATSSWSPGPPTPAGMSARVFFG